MAVVFPSAGIVLAAGAGTPYGVPKPLARAADGTPWVQLATETLLDGGCAQVTVVLGASAAETRELVPRLPRVHTVVEAHWTDGMAAPLRTGMRHLEVAAPPSVSAVAITLVDLPELPVAVVKRLLSGVKITSLRRAVFAGHPGHPVVVGRQHWADFIGALHGDDDGTGYLLEHGVHDVEAGDLWSGRELAR